MNKNYIMSGRSLSLSLARSQYSASDAIYIPTVYLCLGKIQDY